MNIDEYPKGAGKSEEISFALYPRFRKEEKKGEKGERRDRRSPGGPSGTHWRGINKSNFEGTF